MPTKTTPTRRTARTSRAKPSAQPRKVAAKPRKVAAKPSKVAAKPAKTYGARADLGKPVVAFFANAPAATKPILLALKALVEEAAPGATSALKWGMPFYELGGEMIAAIGGHKAHVNLILPGPPGTYTDPDGLLEGEGKTGKHLKVTSVATLPRAAVRGWLATSIARAGG